MRSVFLPFCLLLSACATYAPRPVTLAGVAQPAVMTLPDGDLLPLALAHSPAVAAARSAYEAARHDRAAARRLPPLTLTLTAEYSHKADPEKPWLYAGAVDVPIDSGGRRAGRVTSADIAVDKAFYAYGDALWTARQGLRQAQSDLAFARAARALNQQLADDRDAYRALVARQVTAGEEARGVADQATLDASAAHQALIQAEDSERRAETTLALALNADPAAVRPLGGTLPPDTDIDDGRITALSARALYARGDIHAAVEDYDAAENDLRLAIAGQYPGMSLQPGYTWERGVVKLPLNWALTLPPTDLNRANIKAAGARRAGAGQTLEDKVKSAQAAIAEAISASRADGEVARKSATEDLPLARSMADKAARQQQAGEGGRADTLLAHIALLDAQLAALAARQTADDDRLKLEDALHQPFDPADAATLRTAMQNAAPQDTPK